ncbi:MAG: cytochrome c maturation protein CcmE [Alphaproteobacteria bacterium]|nr:cytochrome c maturation protein CcmE [Alphaproteobacteria bacterium]
MTPKRRRLYLALAALVLLAGAAALALTALERNIVFFVTPTELAERPGKPGQQVRLGGLVANGSVKREQRSARVDFAVTDGAGAINVVYEGILPDLFREGQGVVVEGAMGPDGVFLAKRVLAKHDETYMPPEAVEALKRSGRWRPEAKP